MPRHGGRIGLLAVDLGRKARMTNEGNTVIGAAGCTRSRYEIDSIPNQNCEIDRHKLVAAAHAHRCPCFGLVGEHRGGPIGDAPLRPRTGHRKDIKRAGLSPLAHEELERGLLDVGGYRRTVG